MTESNLSFAPLPNGLCRGERRGGMEEEEEEEEKVEREEGAPTVQQLQPAEHQLTLSGNCRQDDRGV